MSREKIAVVTVHGTNDSAEGPDNDKKWWQPGSKFAERLKSQLAGKGLDADIVPVVWSGANSALGREQGANNLAKTIRRSARDYAGVHVIGHSHGGNVANHAAEMLGWGKRNRRRVLDSLTTVGTPFFKANFGAAEVFGAIAFLVLTVLSFITLTAIVVFSYQQRFANADLAYGQMTAVGVIFLLSLASFLFVLPLAIQGARRLSRFRTRLRTGESIFSIWHRNDEAIAFLQKVENFPITPFSRGALWRGARTPAILWSVRLVMLVVIACLVIGGGALLAIHLANEGALANDSPFVRAMGRRDALTLIAVGVGGALVLFSVIYLAFRVLFGLAPELLLRGQLNKWIGGVVRGMAFGNDGDQRLSDVATASHTHPSTEHVLDGELAARMQANASGAANALIEQYRWALFTVGEDSSEAIARMAEDAMTWNSLIHTTYFDHDEVADTIAEHIARSATEANAAV